MKYLLLILSSLLYLFCTAQTEKVFVVQTKTPEVTRILPELDTLTSDNMYDFLIMGRNIQNIEVNVTGAEFNAGNKVVQIFTNRFTYPGEKVLLQIRDSKDKKMLYAKEFVVVPPAPVVPSTQLISVPVTTTPK